VFIRLPRTTLLLTVIGALCVGMGLSYFVAMTEDTRYEMTETMRQRWQADYDIVVRPREVPARPAGDAEEWTRWDALSGGIWGGITAIRPFAPESETTIDLERDRSLLESNYLAGIPGGITVDQLAAIRAIPGVELAAPIAACGSTLISVEVEPPAPEAEGIYRVNSTFEYCGGPEPVVVSEKCYVRCTITSEGATVMNPVTDGTHPSPNVDLVLPVAAVDPEAEEVLVGLEAATTGRSLPKAYWPLLTDSPGGRHSTYLRIPVLMRSGPVAMFTVRQTVERLTLDAAAIPNAVDADCMRQLDQAPAIAVAERTITAADLQRSLAKDLVSGRVVWKRALNYKAGPVDYRADEGGGLSIEPVGVVHSAYFGSQTLYRRPYMVRDLSSAPGPWLSTGPPCEGCPHIAFEVIGTYDADRLELGRDPLNELPMETYRPGEGLLVRDGSGDPLPEPIALAPAGVDLGILTLPPLMLTTLDVARTLYGEDCISAVRVRVTEADDLSRESQRKVEWVAKEIAVRTGLRVDITIGSSPTRQEVFVAGLDSEPGRMRVPPLGYVELPFVKKNVVITIYNELNRGNLVLLGAVLLVAVFYVLTHASVTVYSRLRALATCRALGWRPGHVLCEIVGGALAFGALAAACGVGLSFVLADWNGLYVPWLGLVLIAAIAVAVYGLGSLAPGLRAARVDPVLAMAAGEAGTRTAFTPRRQEPGRARAGASVTGLALGALLGRWRRQVLTLLTLTVATALLGTFVLVTLRLQGVLCGTLLGDFLIVEVGPRHLLTAALCLALAAVAVAEVVGLNVAERRGEFNLLAALGWRPATLRLMVAGEGALIGLGGGLGGLALAIAALTGYYDVALSSLVAPALAVLPVPVCMGFLGALVPALGVGERPVGNVS